MSTVTVSPLGAGQDVGASCVLVAMGGKTIMFDCGMHMNRPDKFPDFSKIAPTGPYTKHIDLLIISHFHLDHSGAIPVFTEKKGYEGPILMTYPTRAIVPLLLEDMKKVMFERRREPLAFTSVDIKNSMNKVTPVSMKQVININGIIVRPWFAGHVIGAAMWEVCVGEFRVLYTGDYNVVPDRQLGSAFCGCRKGIDALITESTYCNSIRDSRRNRESSFLSLVHSTVKRGGKVLVPVFALGRAQELLLLVDAYWERMHLSVPVYTTPGLVQKANSLYTSFITYSNERIRNTYTTKNVFEFKVIKSFDRSLIDEPGPCVLFATPGMLHGGFSLEVFKRWCISDNNTVILPGYCAPGTVGFKVLHNEKQIDFGQSGGVIPINCQAFAISFSAHADAKGIFQIIEQVVPKNVILVHGEGEKMKEMENCIAKELGIPCHTPRNFDTVILNTLVAPQRKLIFSEEKRSFPIGSFSLPVSISTDAICSSVAKGRIPNVAKRKKGTEDVEEEGEIVSELISNSPPIKRLKASVKPLAVCGIGFFENQTLKVVGKQIIQRSVPNVHTLRYRFIVECECSNNMMSVDSKLNEMFEELSQFFCCTRFQNRISISGKSNSLIDVVWENVPIKTESKEQTAQWVILWDDDCEEEAHHVQSAVALAIRKGAQKTGTGNRNEL